MGDQRNGGIAWTEQTWNPLIGCSKVTAGCANCYAEKAAALNSGPGQYYEKVIGEDGKWNGQAVLVPERLMQPIHWKRPRLIFVNSMSDMFHESLAFGDIAAIFGVMVAAPQHTFQVLTKRPARALEWFKWARQSCAVQPGQNEGCIYDACVMAARKQGITQAWDRSSIARPWPLPNVWLGVSVENQATADERIPLLLQCPAAVRWVSAEPLLGPIVLKMPEVGAWPDHRLPLPNPKEWDDWKYFTSKANGIQWVVVGGESGDGARPMHPDWARALRDQCVEAGVAFLFKQWGDWIDIGDSHELASQGRIRSDNERVVNLAGGHGFHGDSPRTMRHVGKKVAGRELDGKLHDGYPEVRT